MRISVAAAMLVVASATSAGQGITALSPEVHSFYSPMVLEYALDEVFRRQSDPTVETDFHNYICRGVTIEKVTFSMFKFGHEKFRRIKIVSEIFNESARDKLLTLRFELVKGSQVVSADVQEIRAEAGSFAKKSRGATAGPQETTIAIPTDAEGAPYPKLRLTVTLKDY